MTQPATDTQRVHIPEITSSLKTLFILRTVISLGLICAGIGVLLIGSQMLLTSLGSGNENILFEIAGSVKITAGGFGAVVMATSIVPFIFAYKARPTLQLLPTNGGGFNLSSENEDAFKRLSNSAQTNGSISNARESEDVGLSPDNSTGNGNIKKETTDSLAVREIKRAA
ncbi:MAG: hypothetical protein AB2712_15455 [Candidatus Thiodiazotropha sp.]